MSHSCAFKGCGAKAVRFETAPFLPYPDEVAIPEFAEVKTYCASHYAEHECPGHVASEIDAKVCVRCGIHIDSLRP